MRTSFRIFEVFGIEVKVHVSLIAILALFIYAFYVSYPPFGFANFPPTTRIILAVVASILMFGGILAHELAHSLVARRFGVKVKGILLFIFGGLAMMDKIPESPREEFQIAIAGPGMSFLIGFICLALAYIPIKEISALFMLLAYFNIILGVFNLIPAFPMDGGRVLRSILAGRMSYLRATRAAAETGKMIAVLMGIFGLFYNPWLILIALFVYMGANEEERVVTLENVLGNVKVKDIMTKDVITVTPDMKISELVEMMLKNKHLGYPVVQDGKIVGIVTLKDIINANPDSTVGEVMSKEVITISPDATAFEAFKLMSEKNIGRIIVVENGELKGIISRSDLMRVTEILEVMEVLGWKRS